MKRAINFFKDYLVDRFGFPLYRIPVDLGLGCPHKSKEDSGCIFCAEDGARAVHLQRVLNIKEQISEGIKYVNGRYSNAEGNYIAYLQAYTNTFGDFTKLKKLYEEVLSCANFKMLMISTRPDCIADEMIEYLGAINERIETWVEIGVQSSNDKTLEFINRKHDFQSVINASKKLNSIGLKSSAHIIIGLPGETTQDYIKTVRDVCALGFTGIKFHNLLVLKNSRLARHFQEYAHDIPLINEYEYINILLNLLRIIPEDKVVMRLTADAEKSKILFPKWNMPKAKIIETLLSIMEERKISQGDSVGKNLDMESSFLKIKTSDSSFTFYNPVFKENYHSFSGGISEALWKFIKPSKLESRLSNKKELKILDVGFGLGYNALTALNEINKLGGTANIISLELDDSSLALALNLFDTASRESIILHSLEKNGYWTDSKNSIKIIFADARASIKSIANKFDLIYLDAFSTQKNPELWTYDFIKKLASLLSSDGSIITYSASYAVRGAFVRCKMFVGSTEPFGRKNGGTIASFDNKVIESWLSEKDMNIILKSTAGVPYRDVSLKSANHEILKRHEKLISKLRSKGLPKWYK